MKLYTHHRTWQEICYSTEPCAAVDFVRATHGSAEQQIFSTWLNPLNNRKNPWLLRE